MYLPRFSKVTWQVHASFITIQVAFFYLAEVRQTGRQVGDRDMEKNLDRREKRDSWKRYLGIG